MLLVTALFNFILSKKAKPTQRQQDRHGDQGPSAVCVTDGSPPDNNFSFLHLGMGGRGGGRTPAPIARLGPGGRAESGEAMLKPEQTAAPPNGDGEQRRWRERRRRRMLFFRPPEEPAEREMEEMESYGEPDTTSDTAPMITD